MSDVKTWDAADVETVKLIVNGEETVLDSVSANDVRKAAVDAGIKKFTVVDCNDVPIADVSFPVTKGSVTIREYNEGKVEIWTV